jgi:hypothetical protein
MTLGVADSLISDGGYPRLHDGAGQGLVGGEVEVGEDDLAGTEQRPLGRQRLLDLDDEVGALPDGGRVGNDVGPMRGVLLVGDAAALAGPRLDQHLVAGPR